MRTIHPSPTVVRRIVSRLRSVAGPRSTNQHAEMNCGLIHRQGCRTIACHAGWYTLARFIHHPSVIWLNEPCFGDQPGETMMALGQCGNMRQLSHDHGAHVLARDLGFITAAALKEWAERHPDIWGNPHGGHMFSVHGAMSFGKGPHDGILLTHIINWWLTVADRLHRAIPLHSTKTRALAVLHRHDAHDRQHIDIETHARSYRLVRRPYPVDLLALLS